MMRNAVLFSFTVQMAWVALGGLAAFLLGVFCLRRQGTLPDGRRAAGMALFCLSSAAVYLSAGMSAAL